MSLVLTPSGTLAILIGFCGFMQSLQTNSRAAPSLGLSHFIQILQSYYHQTPYGLSTDSASGVKWTEILFYTLSAVLMPLL